MDMRKDIKEKGRENEENIDDKNLEDLLCEQCKKQIRSDYRRSLGNESGRRYKE
jgi:hypothetical protein